MARQDDKSQIEEVEEVCGRRFFALISRQSLQLYFTSFLLLCEPKACREEHLGTDNRWRLSGRIEKFFDGFVHGGGWKVPPGAS